MAVVKDKSINYTASMKSVRKNIQHAVMRHPLLYVIAVCVIAFACYNAVGGNDLSSMVVRAFLAAISVLIVLAVVSSPSQDSTCVKKKIMSVSTEAISESFRDVAWVAGWLLVIATIVGIAALIGLNMGVSASWLLRDTGVAGNIDTIGSLSLVDPSSWSTAQAENVSSDRFVLDAEQALWFLALCVTTGAFEEALFRGVMFTGFARAFSQVGQANPLIAAAVLSSAVFGLLHVTTGNISLEIFPLGQYFVVVLLQLFLKPVQAALFGFVMAAMYWKTNNLWLVAMLHAAFNLLSELPVCAVTGIVPVSYISGGLFDLMLLIGSSLLLAILVIKARPWLEVSFDGRTV